MGSLTGEGGCGRRWRTNRTIVVGVGRGLLPSWSLSSWSLWMASMDWKWGDLRIPSLEIACCFQLRFIHGEEKLHEHTHTEVLMSNKITISYVGVGQFKPLASSHMAD